MVIQLIPNTIYLYLFLFHIYGVFTHAEEKVEPVFRQENAPEERFHLLKLPLKVSKALFPGLQSIFVVLAGTLT